MRAVLAAVVGTALWGALPVRAAEPATAAVSSEPPGSAPVVGPLGLALLGGGAAVLATTASSVILLEQLTASDDNRNPPRFPELVQASGFAALTLASMSAGAMLLGAAMILEESGGATADVAQAGASAQSAAVPVGGEQLTAAWGSVFVARSQSPGPHRFR